MSRYLLLLWALLLVSCAAPVAGLFPPPPGAATVQVCVVRGSRIHTGLAVQQKDLPPLLREAAVMAGAGRDRWIEFGWGEDDGFRKPLTPFIAIRALMGSCSTVMRVEGQSRPDGDALVPVELTQEGFDRLCAFIAGTMAVDATGRPAHLEGPWFRARGLYCACHTCNNWTARALRAAGCPVRPAVCQAPGPLLRQSRRMSRTPLPRSP
jgi:Protein of unknown function (DUF2459)